MKRLFDVCASIATLVPLIPVFLLLAALVRFKLGRPVFFKQVRPGKNAKPFVLLKFRTMAERFDSSGCLLPDGERLTRFGHWLRSTSLDELPALFNVLKGDMSFVGPRPLLMEYLPLYNAQQRKRHEVLPGITGLAQVNGRNAISWEDRFRLDVWYVENQSFLLDLKILARTFAKVIARADINEPGADTMTRFAGNGNNGENANLK